jgi:hypothetical protein
MFERERERDRGDIREERNEMHIIREGEVVGKKICEDF